MRAVLPDTEPLHRTFEGVLEIEFDLVLDVAALRRTRRPSPAPAAFARLIAHRSAEEGAEEIREGAFVAAEHLGDFLFAHRAEPGAWPAPLAAERTPAGTRGPRPLCLLVHPPVGAQLVVLLALDWVGQYFVR